MVESPVLHKDPHEQLSQSSGASTQKQPYDARYEKPLMTQESSFSPQMQTIESVDRQMTQAFNQPLPNQENVSSFQQEHQQEEQQPMMGSSSNASTSKQEGITTTDQDQQENQDPEKAIVCSIQPTDEEEPTIEEKQQGMAYGETTHSPTMQNPTIPTPPTSSVPSSSTEQKDSTHDQNLESGRVSNIREYPCMRTVLTCNYQQDEPEYMLVYLDKYPRPIRLKSDEILVKMKCASVNELDYKICQGKIPCEIQTSPLHYPLIIGADGCGVIEKLGGDQTNLRVGDHVFGFTNQLGTFGEYVVFKEREVIMKPEWMSCEMASTIPFSALAAMNCFLLVDKKRKKKQGLMGPSISVYNKLTMKSPRKGEQNMTDEESIAFEKRVIEHSQSKLLHEKEPINTEVLNQIMNGDKLGSILIQGGDTYIGSWCILLARFYFGAQRIYTTISSMDNEEYVRKLGADVILNSHDTKYEETIERDLAQYWETFCCELDPQKQHQPPTSSTLNTSAGSSGSGGGVGQQQPVVGESVTITQTQQQTHPTQPMTNITTTETVQEQIGLAPSQMPPTQMEYKPSMMQQQETSNLSMSPQQPSYHPLTQWPHPAFKSKKEMEKSKLLVSTIQLSIDTVGGYENMQKSFNLLNGSTSNFITTNPPIEFEQKKVSGKDVWKLVSMAAANRLKSFFANYPHFHLLPAVQCERELMVELIKWFEHLDREWIQRVLPYKTYPLSEAALAMADCKKYPFKLVINVSNE